MMRCMYLYAWKGFLRFSVLANQTMLMTANEAASVTGVPLRQVHRIIDAGLLDGAVKRRDKAKLLTPKALVGLKLAHDTADVLTLRSRRAVVATSIRHQTSRRGQHCGGRDASETCPNSAAALRHRRFRSRCRIDLAQVLFRHHWVPSTD
jgi:hypothetical protein